MDESPSPSDPERERRPATRSFLREEWRELNAVQLVCIAAATVSGFFGVFGGVLVLLSASFGVQTSLPMDAMYTASIPNGVALVFALGAILFTRSGATRRAAWQETSPAVLMALAGFLAVAIAWLVD